MIPKVNLGVGEMGFMFCDLLVSLKQTYAGKIVSTNFPFFDFCLARRHIQFSEFYILKALALIFM